jgi:hypothetical protein
MAAPSVHSCASRARRGHAGIEPNASIAGLGPLAVFKWSRASALSGWTAYRGTGFTALAWQRLVTGLGPSDSPIFLSLVPVWSKIPP